MFRGICPTSKQVACVAMLCDGVLGFSPGIRGILWPWLSSQCYCWVGIDCVCCLLFCILFESTHWHASKSKHLLKRPLCWGLRYIQQVARESKQRGSFWWYPREDWAIVRSGCVYILIQMVKVDRICKILAPWKAQPQVISLHSVASGKSQSYRAKKLPRYIEPHPHSFGKPCTQIDRLEFEGQRLDKFLYGSTHFVPTIFNDPRWFCTAEILGCDIIRRLTCDDRPTFRLADGPVLSPAVLIPRSPPNASPYYCSSTLRCLGYAALRSDS